MPSNILHICLEDHDWIGKNIAAALRNGWTIQGTQAIPSQTAVLRRGERVFLYDDGQVIPDDGSVIPHTPTLRLVNP